MLHAVRGRDQLLAAVPDQAVPLEYLHGSVRCSVEAGIGRGDAPLVPLPGRLGVVGCVHLDRDLV